MAKEVEWHKQFNIGVDSIDNAHRKLFSIVRKLIYLSENENNGQWACGEGLKYLKSYAIGHFADEEAYMRSIGYSGYEMHKCLHDNMRYKTLPALERDLKESGYSQESIQHFLGICLGWLTAHIMVEDRAITGKIPARWKDANTGKNIDALETALAETIQEIFSLPTEVVSEHYSGENFGSSIIDRLVYGSEDGKHLQIFLVLEESLVLWALNSLLDMQLREINKLSMNAVKELCQKIVEQVGIHFHLSSQYQLKNSHLMTLEQFRQEFCMECFDYSLLFNTGTGYFAFCTEQA
ncbi:bacteriohemerythrin [Lachnospiraceae bacterium]|nr:bacteriohemerythrin [Lachnospiraceae bacterium]